MGRNLLMLCWAIAGLGLVGGARTAQAGPSVRIAVLPVVVHSFDGAEHLREGIADMVASRLGQFAELQVVRVEDVGQATTDLVSARATGRSVGADYVLFGSFTHFGEGASLDLSCAPVAEASSKNAGPVGRRVFVQSGLLDEIIPSLDGVVQKVALFLSDEGSLPAVSAPPPGLAQRSSELDVESLVGRVEALERYVFGDDSAEVPEQDLSQTGLVEEPEAAERDASEAGVRTEER